MFCVYSYTSTIERVQCYNEPIHRTKRKLVRFQESCTVLNQEPIKSIRLTNLHRVDIIVRCYTRQSIRREIDITESTIAQITSQMKSINELMVIAIFDHFENSFSFRFTRCMISILQCHQSYDIILSNELLRTCMKVVFYS